MNKQQLLQNEIKMSENLSLNKDNKRKKVLTTFFSAVGLIGAGFTAYYILYSSNFVSTDNAYSAVEIAQVTPSVNGIISDVLVTDTQMVKKGVILVKIEQTDAKLALDQAQASYDSAIRRVKSYMANDNSLIFNSNSFSCFSFSIILLLSLLFLTLRSKTTINPISTARNIIINKVWDRKKAFQRLIGSVLVGRDFGLPPKFIIFA